MDTEVLKPADLSGQIIGNYHITSRLGRGGMADVYKALHTELKVHRAVKFIRPEFVTSEDFVARFQKEAQAVAKLEHPNIVRIHDFGNANNQFYMVMQFVEGLDLKNSLATTGPLASDAAIDLIVPVANALTYAHERDLIHRDIKPDNIMLGDKGEPILMDFGIAKLLTENTSLTQTGVGIGTPAYMAPEQAQGQSITPATDVYALAVVLYELVTGRQPFSADTPLAVMLKAISDPLPLPRGINPAISEELQAVILKGTAKDPAARYQTASEFVDDLKKVRTGSQPTIARRAPVSAAAGATTVVSNAPSKSPGPAGMAATFVRGLAWVGGLSVLAAGAAGYWWWNSDKPIDQSPGATEVVESPRAADSNSQASAATTPPAGSSGASSSASSPATTPSPERQTTSAPPAPIPQSLTTETITNKDSGELWAWRDTLEAGETKVSNVELTKGDHIYLRVLDTDETTDFTVVQPDGRSNLLSVYKDSGPVEVKVTGTHQVNFKTRDGAENSVDVQLFRINPFTLDGGAISLNDNISATTDWPGQRLSYQAELAAGDTVYLEVVRADNYTDFTMLTLDQRKNLFSNYTHSGPHQITKAGTYQFFADPRRADLGDFEFILHKLSPAIIPGGNYVLNSRAENSTTQPGQRVDYTVDLETNDVVYLEVSRTSDYTDFLLQTPDGRKDVFSHYTHSGPHTVKQSGAFRFQANPRGSNLSEYEFKLHKLNPAVIQGGELTLNDTVSVSTTQPGQIVTYTLTLNEPTNVGFNLISASSYTDFTLLSPDGRKELFSNFRSVKAQLLVPGTYTLRADPRANRTSDIEFRMTNES